MSSDQIVSSAKKIIYFLDRRRRSQRRSAFLDNLGCLACCTCRCDRLDRRMQTGVFQVSVVLVECLVDSAGPFVQFATRGKCHGPLLNVAEPSLPRAYRFDVTISHDRFRHNGATAFMSPMARKEPQRLRKDLAITPQ